MHNNDESEIPQELHELNIAQGKIKGLMGTWDELTDEERREEIEQCISLLEYPADRLGDADA